MPRGPAGPFREPSGLPWAADVDAVKFSAVMKWSTAAVRAATVTRPGGVMSARGCGNESAASRNDTYQLLSAVNLQSRAELELPPRIG